jgi:hypothetical protein
MGQYLRLNDQKIATGPKFKFRATKLWNDLDCKFTDISSFITFKKQLKLNMLSITFA